MSSIIQKDQSGSWAKMAYSTNQNTCYKISNTSHDHCMPKQEPELDPGIPNLPNTLIPKPNS